MPLIRATLLRAIRTAAQTAIAAIGTTTVLSGVDWQVVASTTALASLLSLLTSVVTTLPEAE